MRSPFFHQEHESFRTEIRQFLATHALPYLVQWEKSQKIPREFWRKMGEHNLLGLHYPTTEGGAGKDIFYSVVFLEELARTGFGGFRVSIALHSYMASYYISHAGSEYLKENYLKEAISGKKISALAITESQAGSDLSLLSTYAEKIPEGLKINGAKKFVANGTFADFFVVAVKTGQTASKNGATGVSLVIVDAKAKGLRIKKINTLGWKCLGTAELTFKNVVIPPENIIGKENLGFIYMMKCLQLERFVAGMLALSGIDHCLRITWDYISQRKAFNQTLSKFQAIRHRLVDIFTQKEAIKQFAYHTAWLLSQKILSIKECSALKLCATELALKAAHECMQWHGAEGYQSNSAISRVYRDSQAATVAGGASEIMRDIIAQIAFEEREGE